MEGKLLTKPDNDAVPRWVAVAFAGFATLVVGAGFAWIHSDVSTFRSEIHSDMADLRTEIRGLRDNKNDDLFGRATLKDPFDRGSNALMINTVSAQVENLVKQVNILTQRVDDIPTTRFYYQGSKLEPNPSRKK